MNKFEDIRGVAFDLDGTLVDSAPGLAAAVDMALYALEEEFNFLFKSLCFLCL